MIIITQFDSSACDIEGDYFYLEKSPSEFFVVVTSTIADLELNKNGK